MISDEELEEISVEYALRFEKINVEYLELMGKHVKEIGSLTPTDIKRLKQMVKYGGNVSKITKKLKQASDLTSKQLSNLYDQLIDELYQDAAEFYLLKKSIQLPLKLNKELQTFLESMKKLTENTFENMSNTTVVSKVYKKVIDEAIQATATGTSDYYSQLKKILNQAATGARVKYESGLTRRLDSAARMNITEGVRRLQIGARQIMGQQFGADGVELSAHALCAPDHIDYQGLQYSAAETKIIDGAEYISYEEMDGGLRRHIGTCNCKHYTFPVILGIGEPAFSKSDLEKFKKNSEEIIKVFNSEYTRYGCSQLMRKLETKMRYAKDKIIFSKNAGDKETEKKTRKQLSDLQKKYREVSAKAGLAKDYKRAYVPGFK